MPLQGAPLAPWCYGSASLCQVVRLDCSRCNTIWRAMAEQRQEERRTGYEEQGKEEK